MLKNTSSKTEVGRDATDNDIGRRGTALAAPALAAVETEDYTLEFRWVRYHLGPEFDIAEANVLQNGNKYNLWFPNYTVQSGRPVPSNNKQLQSVFQFQLNH